MNTIIITRHGGAIDWLRRKGFDGEVIPHLSEIPAEPTRVVGVLPLLLAYKMLKVGHEVYLIEFPPRNGPRGAELTADEMESAGAKLLRFGLRESHLCGDGDRWVAGITAAGCDLCGGYYSVHLVLHEV